ncbi:MAG: Gfo/Idh/MocA family oxidoreductase [Bacillota bacterium]|nr:Gfo/Idh/MocA family oxidoreductase [Bacillota bacterium]
MYTEPQVVTVGTVGGGYAAYLHGNGYAKVSGVTVRLKGVCDIDAAKAEAVRDAYGYEYACSEFDELLADADIDVIDIVTPPFLHISMVKKALQAGKHVICEKPLTGYFGAPGEQNVGATPKSLMYKQVMAELDDLRQVIASSGKKFLFAENFVYATPVQKAAEIVRAKKSKILFLKGEESLKGSSSPVAGKWNCSGGGTLSRTGCHPLGGMLWLKQQEAAARGERITIRSVVADIGVATACLNEDEHRHIAARPEDVEDFGVCTVTFSDGTKSVTMATDTVLGGTKNYIEVYCNDAALICNITPTDILNTYFLDQRDLDDVYIAEMLPAKLGWNKAFVNDEIIRGYVGEMQDFVETIAYDREPTSGFELAYQVTQVLHAAYVSAEEGRRVEL